MPSAVAYWTVTGWVLAWDRLTVKTAELEPPPAPKENSAGWSRLTLAWLTVAFEVFYFVVAVIILCGWYLFHFPSPR